MGLGGTSFEEGDLVWGSVEGSRRHVAGDIRWTLFRVV
jgi:hypothetical protein